MMTAFIRVVAVVALVMPGWASGHQETSGRTDRGWMEAEIIRAGSVTLSGIAVDADQYTIRVLREVLALLKEHDEWRFEVQGHADSAGGPAASQARSERSASAVVSWLTGHGIAADRLVATGYGDTRPVADHATGDGRAKNRRIVLRKLNEE